MINEILKEYRKKSGQTQEALGKRLNMHRDRIRGIEQGTGKVSLNELQELVKAINCKILIIETTQL